MNDIAIQSVRAMLVFAKVVDAGSFAAAARNLGISRAVVSYQIKQHEALLGVRLLNRSTRKISLTAAGINYYKHCKLILNEATEAHNDIQNLKQEAVGKVSLACPVNLGLRWIVPVANAFMRRYPQIELDINFSETVANVVESGIDLAVRAGPLPDSELHALKLTSLTRHICAAPSYFANRGVPIALDELKQHQWIVYSRLASKVVLYKDGQSFAIPIKGSLRTNDASARLQFAIAGQGLAVLPSYDAKEAIASGKLIELMSDYSLPELELYGVFSKGATQAKATRLLLDMLREYPPDRISLLPS